MPGMLEQQQGATVLESNEQGRVEGDGAERGRQVIPADPLGLGLRVRGAWSGCGTEGQRRRTVHLAHGSSRGGGERRSDSEYIARESSIFSPQGDWAFVLLCGFQGFF